MWINWKNNYQDVNSIDKIIPHENVIVGNFKFGWLYGTYIFLSQHSNIWSTTYCTLWEYINGLDYYIWIISDGYLLLQVSWCSILEFRFVEQHEKSCHPLYMYIGLVRSLCVKLFNNPVQTDKNMQCFSQTSDIGFRCR